MQSWRGLIGAIATRSVEREGQVEASSRFFDNPVEEADGGRGYQSGSTAGLWTTRLSQRYDRLGRRRLGTVASTATVCNNRYVQLFVAVNFNDLQNRADRCGGLIFHVMGLSCGSLTSLFLFSTRHNKLMQDGRGGRSRRRLATSPGRPSARADVPLTSHTRPNHDFEPQTR